MGPVGFRLLSSGIATVVEGVYVFFDVAGGRRCARVFELLVHLGAGARRVVLPSALCAYNFSQSRVPSRPLATAFHRVSVGFLLSHREILREER